MFATIVPEFLSDIEVDVAGLQRTGDGCRTIIIDSCPLFREGLQQAFRDTAFTVVAAESDLKSVHLNDDGDDGSLLIILAASDDLPADTRAVQQALARFPGSTLVSLCQDCSPQRAALLLRAGAGAILPVPQHAEEIVDALELVTLGQRVVPLHLISSCLNGGEPCAIDALDPGTPVKIFADMDNKAIRLSLREVEILQCLLAGESNRSVARRLLIAEATVKVHIKAILRKIKVKNRTQAAIWAVSNMGGLPTRSAGAALLDVAPTKTLLEPHAA